MCRRVQNYVVSLRPVKVVTVRVLTDLIRKGDGVVAQEVPVQVGGEARLLYLRV